MKVRLVANSLSKYREVKGNLANLEKLFSGLNYTMTGVSQFFSSLIEEFARAIDPDRQLKDLREHYEGVKAALEEQNRKFTARLGQASSNFFKEVRGEGFQTDESAFNQAYSKYEHYNRKLAELNQDKNDKIIRMKPVSAEDDERILRNQKKRQDCEALMDQAGSRIAAKSLALWSAFVDRLHQFMGTTVQLLNQRFLQTAKNIGRISNSGLEEQAFLKIKQDIAARRKEIGIEEQPAKPQRQGPPSLKMPPAIIRKTVKQAPSTYKEPESVISFYESQVVSLSPTQPRSSQSSPSSPAIVSFSGLAQTSPPKQTIRLSPVVSGPSQFMDLFSFQKKGQTTVSLQPSAKQEHGIYGKPQPPQSPQPKQDNFQWQFGQPAPKPSGEWSNWESPGREGKDKGASAGDKYSVFDDLL